jgi:hypothetical protein
MENPAGILRARVFGRRDAGGEFAFPWVAYERNAQLYMSGYFRVHRPSARLTELCGAVPA